MKKILIGLVGLVIVLGAAFALFRGAILERAIPRIIEQRLMADLVGDLPDGLHVFVCGAGSPMPNPNAGGPCLTVIAGKSVYMVDAGTGGIRTMALNGINASSVKGVLLTHFHSDHIDGLGETQMLRWAQGGHTTRLPIYGPTGVERIAKGINITYMQDFTYRVAHHGEDIVPPSGAGVTPQPFEVPAEGEAVAVLEDGDLTVVAFSVDHSPVSPAVGYLFTYKDRSVLISGDTSKSDNLEHFAKDVDLLMHEGLAPNLVGLMEQAAKNAGQPRTAKLFHDILDYHASPKEAAQTAQAAGADMLGFYHIVPPILLAPMEDLYLEGVADAYNGPVVMSEDGMFYHLPAGSDDISVK